MADAVLLEVEGGIATITVNRPEALNALNRDVTAGLMDAFARVENDPEVRVVVVRGAGDHFMAGGDLKMFHELVHDADPGLKQSTERLVADVHLVIMMMRRMPKPVIASVRGAAAGFGLSFMMATDLTIAADDSYFTLAYILIGTSPDGGSTYSLPRIVGMKKAMEIAMLGDRFDAATALDLGLVNQVVPAAELEAATAKLAGRLAKGPGVALGRTKLLVQTSLNTSLESQLQREADFFSSCAASEDFKEGVSAFVEKRKPEFEGG